jgi:hypothetical protein
LSDVSEVCKVYRMCIIKTQNMVRNSAHRADFLKKDVHSVHKMEKLVIENLSTNHAVDCVFRIARL